MSSRLRKIPAVERILQALPPNSLPRPLVTHLVRQALDRFRRARSVPDFPAILQEVERGIDEFAAARLQRVINGTGILIHTNLGRAPLEGRALDAITEAASAYVNLEYDLIEGARSGRAVYLDQILARLCRSEAATVVNNCAAALFLVLRHCLSEARTEVIVSRGELVQIGGGFRIPEILEASGARLREVGTTNKTALADYARAVRPATALILKVHRSNFFMEGFVESAGREELALLARQKKIPFLEDLGSGAMIRTEIYGSLAHEPTPAEVLRAGVDLVCFSGDKLLGGPQAGIIAGRAKLIAGLKREPLLRALRCDKLVLSGLQSVAEFYLETGDTPARGSTGGGLEREREIPLLAMMAASEESLRQRGTRMLAALAALGVNVRLGRGRAQLGGGTLPRSELASVTLEIDAGTIPAAVLAQRLRRGKPPIVGCISGGKFKLDLRTIFPAEDEEVVRGLSAALGLLN